MSASLVVALIDEGNALEERGRLAEAMARYEAAIRADPRCARAHLNRGNVLLADGRIDEARKAYELAIACDAHYAAAHFNLGNLNCHAGDYQTALNNYRAATSLKPDFANAFVGMGNALDSLGRRAEARMSYERALAINPGDSGIHMNLGVLAIAEGRPEEAEASLRRALAIAPDSGEILYQLVIVLLAANKAPEAVQLTLANLERAPTWMTKAAFARCAARATFRTDDTRVRTALTAALTEPWGIPFELCRPALSLIMLDRRIAACVRRTNATWPARLSRSALFDAESLAVLAADPLLRVLLQTVPVSSIEFERFLTALRYVLLELATSGHPPDPADIAAIPLYAALARQCFINEYILDCDERERAAAAACRASLLALLDAHAPVPPLLVCAVAAYFPLCALPKPERLLAGDLPDPVEELLRQQVREPLEEQALRAGVAHLTRIAHGVSAKVREQYEENPYPRWVKLPAQDPSLHFNAELRLILPLARFVPMPDDSQPEVLVAGCGTGSQPILLAQQFRGARLLAVDLSLNSLGYAIRKTRELGIKNIEYAQADILELGAITRTFDVIAAGGVLHHLADPFRGWRTLLSRLRPGGFMHLGLYSQLARRHVVKAREFIAARGYTSTPDDIRRFRRDLAAQAAASADLQRLSERLSKTPDFYSTSECRDWVFHVQEQRLTLDEIESFLTDCGLSFLGFQLDPQVLQQYRTRFPDDPAAINLRNWARFEADNPDTFIGMYQFWIQRSINH